MMRIELVGEGVIEEVCVNMVACQLMWEVWGGHVE